MKSRAILVGFVFLLLSAFSLSKFSSNVSAVNDFKTGWWIDRESNTYSIVDTYSSQGNTLVLLVGWMCSTSQIPEAVGYLNRASANGIKMIMGIECGPVPSFNDADLETVINAFKNHPALFAYYVGDEPEFRDETWRDSLQKMSGEDGYYQKIKNLDPNHPILISFNQFYYNDPAHYLLRGDLSRILVFLPVVDIVGMHNYPFWSVNGEFGGSDARLQYDKWKTIYDVARSNNKDFIATMQGFGDNTISPYRNPTTKELRYQIFTAVVQGIDKVLFWLDSWGERSGMLPLVAQMIGQIQSIGSEMNYGVTNDSRISVVIPDGRSINDRLVYRFGTSANNNTILAVNIANRTSSSGATLSNVQFTLPLGVNVTQVTVLHEGRTIPVNNRQFIDTFSPFEVHMYRFSSTVPLPTNTPTRTATFTPTVTTVQLRPGDANADGRVDELDYAIWLQHYNTLTSRGYLDGDFNNSGRVDGVDYVIWWRNHD